jgi:hypothetical protein
MGFLVSFILFGLVSTGWILWARIKKRRANKLSVFGLSLLLSTIVLMPLTYALHHVLPRSLPYGSTLSTFDPNIWKLESSKDWNEGISIREQMLYDLITNVLPGKNKEQIEYLLGPSLETGYFRSINKDLIYYLGPERGGLFSIDSEWLLVWIDEEGIFEHYKIVND